MLSISALSKSQKLMRACGRHWKIFSCKKKTTIPQFNASRYVFHCAAISKTLDPSHFFQNDRFMAHTRTALEHRCDSASGSSAFHGGCSAHASSLHPMQGCGAARESAAPAPAAIIISVNTKYRSSISAVSRSRATGRRGGRAEAAVALHLRAGMRGRLRRV